MSFALAHPAGIALDPVASFALLERAILAGAPNSHLRFILDALKSNRFPASYSSAEIARITGKTESTATNIRRFVEQHDIFGGLWEEELPTSPRDPQKIPHDMYDNTSKPDISSHIHAQKSGQAEIPSLEPPLLPLLINSIPLSPPNPQEKQAFLLACQGLKKIGWGKKEGWQILDIAAFVTEYGALNVLYAQWMAQGPNVKNPAAVVTSNLKYRGVKAPKGWLPPQLREKIEQPQNTQLPVFTSDKPKIPASDSPLLKETLTTPSVLVQLLLPNLRSGDEGWFNQLHIDESSKDLLILKAPDYFPQRLIDVYGKVIDRACQKMGYTAWQIEFVKPGK
jgi:hypothetical protein